MRRTLLGVAAALALFSALVYPSRWASLYAVRELLRGAHAAGLMEGGLGGQILGFNYRRNPRWVHAAAGVIGTGIGFAPAVAASLLVMRRVGRRRWVRGRWDLARLAGACAVFGAVASVSESRLRYPVQDLIVEWGEGTGMTTYYISVLVVGLDGPFHGDGAATAAWNCAWRHVPWVVPALMGAAAAGAAFVCVGGLRAGYGKGACRGCGYPVEGLARCPECGRSA